MPQRPSAAPGGSYPAVGELAAADQDHRAWHHRIVDVTRRHPTWADTAVGLLLFVLALPTLVDPSPTMFPEGVRDGDALGVVLLAGMTLPLALRRRYPVAVAVATMAATVPFLVRNYADAVGTLGVLIALYSVGAHCERRVAVRAGIALFVPFVLLLVAGVASPTEDLPAPVAIANLFTFWGAWAVGDAFRSRRAYVAELRLRLDATERLHEEEAAVAVAAERARIARELHDVVAHGLSVMVVQAGAARAVLDHRPDQAADALGQIERTGREAMAEMRRLLGVLRTEADAADPTGGRPDGPPLARTPQPGLDQVDGLVASWAAAGMPVRLEHHRHAAPPAGADLAAFRIVQEALTNVARHAGPVRDVQVRVVEGEQAIELSVIDDGRGASTTTDAATVEGGHGLLGMRERAALYGGQLQAGPRPGGGWSVQAELGAAR